MEYDNRQHSSHFNSAEDKTRILHFKSKEARSSGWLSLNGLAVQKDVLSELLRKLPSLLHLYLSGCHLKGTLPSCFGILAFLQTLDLSNNFLEEIPACLLANLVSLVTFDLSHNRLARLSAGVAMLTHLRELNLAQNKLIDLPREIGDLPYLTLLDASNNLLRNIPEELCCGLVCVHLKTLRLQGNVLVELPENLGKLVELEELDVRDNNLWRLPISARGLTQLQVLGHSGNRWRAFNSRSAGTARWRQEVPLECSYGVNALETLYMLIEQCGHDASSDYQQEVNRS